VKSVLGATLGVEDRAGEFDASTPLLGGLPELDSLAAVELIAGPADTLRNRDRCT
jgi:acyl carrier protein